MVFNLHSIVGAVGVLAVVIFVHEFGHFLVAKWCDVEIRVFSMGFGPTLLARSFGETEYRLSLIPLGGYVRMAGSDGEEEPASDPSRGFSAKSLLRRTAIVVAGPGVNLLFAFLVFASVAFFYGRPVPSHSPRVGGVVTETPASRAGLQRGDLITAIDGVEVAAWKELSERVRESQGKALLLTVQASDGTTRSIEVVPEPHEQRDYFGEVVGSAYMIGIERAMDHRRAGAFESLGLGVKYTWFWTHVIGETLLRLIQGRISISDLGGPILIAQEAGRRAATGMEPLLQFLALISVNLGVINILPLPVLDGGHLLFFLIERLRGRPLSLRYRELVQQVGVFLLVALMVFVVFNDISRIVGE